MEGTEKIVSELRTRPRVNQEIEALLEEGATVIDGMGKEGMPLPALPPYAMLVDEALQVTGEEETTSGAGRTWMPFEIIL